MLVKIKETSAYINKRISEVPYIGLILGSGIGDLAKEIEADIEIPYKEIPNFPLSTVDGHQGQMIFGKLNGVQVVALQGRFHFYEGYSM